METKLGEGFLVTLADVLKTYRSHAYPLVHIQLAEDLSGVQEMRVAHDPVRRLVSNIPAGRRCHVGRRGEVLVHVVCHERQVEDKCDPVSIDEEEES